MIYEDQKTGDVIREECQFCATQYAETAAKLLKARPALKNAPKAQQTAAFDAAYGKVFIEEMKKRAAAGEMKFGAALLNTKHEFIVAAPGDDAPYECGKEGEVCQCIGTVRYGVSGKFFTKPSTGSLECSNDVFGDPIPG